MRRIGLVCMAILSALQVRPQMMLFDRITTSDGLPSEEVLTLFEDRDGFPWVGTVDGLARLEGTRVRVFHHDHNDSTSLAHDQVNAIAQDSTGVLWFATMDGLSRLDPLRGTFSNRRIPAMGNEAHQANRMREVLAPGDGTLWVVTEAGLYRYHIGDDVFQQVQDSPPGESPAGSVTAAGALCWDHVNATLWAGTSSGIASWSAATGKWTDRRTTDQEPWASTAGTNAPVIQSGELWFLREDTYDLYAFEMRSGELHLQDHVEHVPNRFTVRCQAFDPRGGHWLSTWTHRLFHRPPGGEWQEVRADPEAAGGLVSARVRRILHTRAGEQWFATDKGIAVLHPEATANRMLAFDRASVVSTILPLGEDTLLIGTESGGVGILDMRTGATTRLTWRGPAGSAANENGVNHINAIRASGSGSALVCTGRGMAELLPERPRLRPLGTIHKVIPHGEVTDFTFAVRAEGALWLGTWSRGLWRCGSRDGPCDMIDTTDGPYGRLPSRMMLCWLTDRNGRHWLGMNDGGGLACMENGRFRTITDAKGANVGGVVRCMAEAPDGTLWLGTHEQGIVVYDPRDGTTHHLTRRNGLPGTRILALLFTRDRALWVSTGQGYAHKAPGAKSFRSFALPVGLRELGPSPALVELPDGRIAMGVGGDILLHDPSGGDPQRTPEPVFTSYRVNDVVTLGWPPSLTLGSDRKALSLELGTVGHRGTGAPQFRYRLSPADTVWKELGPAKRLDLFDLAPGTYDIDVQASSDGVHWSDGAARAEVEVLPPFYATWWFRSIVFLLIAAAAILGFRLYLTDRLRAQREVFEREQAVLAERVRIANDMHDDLGAGLSALKLRSEMALRVEKDPEKREQLGSLANTAGEIISSMRQIIWTMNADQGSLADLASYTANYVRSYCADNELVAEVVVPPAWPDIALTAEQRRNIFLVVKEALHNTVKHANASTVRFTMTVDAGLVVEVTDNGLGLPVSVQETVGNGLRNMRKRIRMLGGELHAEAVEGSSGTRIRFEVPLPGPVQGSIGRKGAA